MQAWNNLKPNQKRYAVIGMSLAALAGGVALMPSGGSDRESEPVERPITDIIGESQTSEARLDRLIAQIENVRSDNANLKQRVEELNSDIREREMSTSTENDAALEQVQVLTDRLTQLETSGITYEPGDGEGTVIIRSNGGGTRTGSDGEPDGRRGEIAEPTTMVPRNTSLAVPEPGTPDTAPLDETRLWVEPAAPAPTQEATRRTANSGNSTAGEQAGVQSSSEIKVIGGAKQKLEAEQAASPTQEQKESFYIPAGSILTGTLITGMDAPTGQNARAEPFPAMMRIKHEAILPNRYRADVRECFVIVGGYGDLSSERAYLRGETISCITHDGQVMETSINSYTVGEDGKAGLRGRLVTKQGQIMAKAAAADVLKEFSGAFANITMPEFDSDSDEGALAQLLTGQTLQSAGGSAASGALNRIAQYYIDQADGMYPVIEIDAGREVEMIVSQGFSLTPT